MANRPGNGQTVTDQVQQAASVPEFVHESTPGGYIQAVLPLIRDAQQQLTYARRLLVDEALSETKLTRAELADLAGVAESTISRWRVDPLTVNQDGTWTVEARD